jgi:predicted transcriptional regulator
MAIKSGQLMIRDRLKIRILNLLNEAPASKTKIMFEAGLSKGQMRVHIPDLIKDECIEYNHRLRVYKIRDKGKRFSESLSSISIAESKLNKTY